MSETIVPTSVRKIIRAHQLIELWKIAGSTLWNWRRNDPTFPKGILLGVNSIGFMEDELNAWLETRRAAFAADKSGGKMKTAMAAKRAAQRKRAVSARQALAQKRAAAKALQSEPASQPLLINSTNQQLNEESTSDANGGSSTRG